MNQKRTSGRLAVKRHRLFLIRGGNARIVIASLLLLSLLVADAGCFLKAESSPFYGRVLVPAAQEFRWSDGGLPQVFDPAFAAAPPDTDAVRAMFEGLTDYDPQTLRPVPAVATRWESSDDSRVWTFYLRDDARWSTGEPVTAKDFVRSWQRTLNLGEQAPHTEASMDFHVAVADAANNELLSATVAAYRDLLVQTLHDMRDVRSAKMTQKAHEEILDAIRAHDPDAARKLMLEHLRDFEKRLRRWLATQEQATIVTRARHRPARTG